MIQMDVIGNFQQFIKMVPKIIENFDELGYFAIVCTPGGALYQEVAVIVLVIFLGQFLSKGERCNEVYPT